MAHICQHLTSLAQRSPQQILTTCGDRQQTCSGVAERVAALAAGLAEDLGIQLGDRVALAALNTDHHLEALLAVLAAGGLVAPLNWRWSVQDALAALAPCAPSILIVDEACSRFADLAQQLPSLRQVVTLGDAVVKLAAPVHAVPAQQLISLHSGAPLTLRAADSGAAVLCFTSGTSAAPKGAVLSHTAFHVQSLNKLLAVGYCADDVHYHAAPLCHVGGLSSLFAVLMAGGQHIFPSRFSAAAMIDDLDRHQVSSFIAVPAMLVALCEAADNSQRHAFQHVKRVLVGGGTPTDGVLNSVRQTLPAASIKLSYAMTEAASSMTFRTLAIGDSSAAAGASTRPPLAGPLAAAAAVCVGRPAPGVELEVQPAAGLPPGHGMIRTRGPHVMLGYWSEGGGALRPRPDAWMDTGDMGYFDADGQLWLLGRGSDVIRSGSETVHASEVEKILQGHPDVLAAAVVGLPHARLGEQVTALVQVRVQGARSAAQWQRELQALCRQRGLSSFKVPGAICCQTAVLPVNNSGKVVKHEVKALLLETLRRHGAVSKL